MFFQCGKANSYVDVNVISLMWWEEVVPSGMFEKTHFGNKVLLQSVGDIAVYKHCFCYSNM